MKKTKTNIPELRFPGFEGEWEEKKLGEVAEIKGRIGFRGYTTNDIVASKLNGAITLSPSNIIDNKVTYNKLVYLSLGKYNESPEIQIEENDIILVKTGSSYGKAAIIKRLPWIATINPQLVVIKSKHINSYILAQMICLPTIQKQIETTIVGGTIPTLSQESISNFNLKVSSFVEQGKIASFLGTVDQKIEQLEKMVVLQEKYKKGMMQRIFNQEIRFKSSNGTPFPAWQQKKLGDIGAFISTNSLSRDKLNYEIGVIYNIHYGDIHTKFNHLFSIEKEKVPFINESETSLIKDANSLCKELDIIIADASEDYNDIGKMIEIIDIGHSKVVAGLHTVHFRPLIKFAKGYNAFLFQSNFIRTQIQSFAQGISVLGISKTNLQKLIINYPCIEEQEKIAGFLSALDEKIEQSQAELEKAKNWKKGLMQRLFV
ncbi:MAG: restriction endonuclease subunit S [Tannerellaceae bacterium]